MTQPNIHNGSPPQASCPACGHAACPSENYADGKIFLCPDCRLQWSQVETRQDGFVPTDNLRYLDPDSLGDAATYPPYVRFFRHLEELFGTSLPLRILDVGSGGGGFVAECLRLGHDAYGVEADESLRGMQPPGVVERVRFARVEDLDDLGRPYHCITFWDSFEHMEGAFALLERLRPALVPGGVFYLRVNNNRESFNFLSLSMLKLCPPVGRHLLHGCFNLPHHAWNFSERAMTLLLHGHDFSVLSANFDETPASRLTANPAFALAIRCVYLLNALLGTGKVGNYFVAPAELLPVSSRQATTNS